MALQADLAVRPYLSKGTDNSSPMRCKVSWTHPLFFPFLLFPSFPISPLSFLSLPFPFTYWRGFFQGSQVTRVKPLTPLSPELLTSGFVQLVFNEHMETDSCIFVDLLCKPSGVLLAKQLFALWNDIIFTFFVPVGVFFPVSSNLVYLVSNLHIGEISQRLLFLIFLIPVDFAIYWAIFISS